MHTRTPRGAARRRWLAAAALAVVALPAAAQHDPYNAAEAVLDGTLAKAKQSGVVLVGHRTASVPFSYLSARGEPIGYSVDICRAIVDEMSQEVGRDLKIQWVPVTSDTRMAAITSGKADLECGSTTANREREKQVAFSPTVFVAGTKLMVRRDSGIQGFRDLGGKTVVYTAGTTNEKALRDVSQRFGVPMTLVAAPDHDASYAMVESGKAAAFSTDDVLLAGLIATHDAREKFAVVGDYLSYDPYGIMFRKGDARMARAVGLAVQRMAASREMAQTYDRWFLRQLPSGQRMNLPMSAQLTEMINVMGGDISGDGAERGGQSTSR